MRKRVSAAALLAVVLALAVPGVATAQPTGLPPLLQTAFLQDFETDASGWFDADDAWFGSVERVAAGTNGIQSASGGFHAEFEGHPTPVPSEGNGHTGAYSQLGGYTSVWPGTWVAEVAVYIDPAAFEIGEGFDYSVAANGTDNAHEQDFVFNTGKQADGRYLIGFANGTNFDVMMNLESDNHVVINSAGWYILQHVFEDDGGVLAVTMNVLNADRLELGDETHRYEENTIPDVIGGNRYGWFTFISLGMTLPVDHTMRQVQDTTGFPVDFGALSALGQEVDGPAETQTIDLQGAINTQLAGRARFAATMVLQIGSPILGCVAISSAEFTITFADGTSLTAAIDPSKWTNFGVACSFLGSTFIAITSSVTSNTSGYGVLEQTIAFGMEIREGPAGMFAFKGNFLNGPLPPPEFEMP